MSEEYDEIEANQDSYEEEIGDGTSFVIYEHKFDYGLLVRKNGEWYVERCGWFKYYLVAVRNFFFPPKQIKP